MKTHSVFRAALAGIFLWITAVADAGPTRELFRMIETKHYAEAEQRIRRSLETAQGEDRNIYIFVLGFVLAKQTRLAEARSVLSQLDPKSEWAEEARFLIEMYGASSALRSMNGGPLVSIQLGAGPHLVVGRDRFTRSGRSLRKNGKPISSPYDLPEDIVYEGRRYRGKLEVSVEKDRVLLVNSLSVEEYLYGVLKNEIGPSWHVEALKAQAIASRTYVLRRLDLARASGQNPVRLAADVSIQVYRGRTSEDLRVTAAVDATRGQVLTYRGDLIEAVFHSESGGVTESAHDLWNRGYPYLVSKPDPYAGASPRVDWEAEFSEEAILRALDKKSRGAVGKIRKIDVTDTTVSGRAKQLTLQGTRGRVMVPAGKFRLSLGPDKVRSLYWTEVRYAKGRLFVRGRGWGHGVGMPQWSAKVAAERGLRCEDILKYYFSGSEIETRY